MFLRILRAPEIRELVNFGGHRDSRKKYWETLNAIAENIKKYLTVVLQSKGPRTTVNQRAYRTVLAACTGSNLRRQKNLRLASDVLVRTCDASILCCFILCCVQRRDDVIFIYRELCLAIYVEGCKTGMHLKSIRDRDLWHVHERHTGTKCPTRYACPKHTRRDKRDSMSYANMFCRSGQSWTTSYILTLLVDRIITANER